MSPASRSRRQQRMLRRHYSGRRSRPPQGRSRMIRLQLGVNSVYIPYLRKQGLRTKSKSPGELIDALSAAVADQSLVESWCNVRCHVKTVRLLAMRTIRSLRLVGMSLSPDISCTKSASEAETHHLVSEFLLVRFSQAYSISR
jgi:hypothetical protein